ncbi:iron ABC transporter permease [Allostreptomyces psammosilenae]|uniref:Iron complex transport system permease protein n=1 Tax=Allostreptomyces psammosilenae TaxID=1892865 RepID=A0A853A0L9_9ACTN|nr:iron ABC transporter permease [Allostreptomyces psammosilenae]NYI04361.1 iron complex transport system permease protein [Allostreptomyces psammosilenae]
MPTTNTPRRGRPPRSTVGGPAAPATPGTAPHPAPDGADAPHGKGPAPERPQPGRPGLAGRATLLSGALLLLALGAVVVLHLSLGAAGVGTRDLIDLIAGRAGEDVEAVFVGSRLPRTLAGLVTGIALGVSGALIQGATRNPLGAPDTLGVNAGAYLAVALVAFMGWGGGVMASGIASFLGAAAAIGVVYLLAARGVLSPGRLLLAGATVALIGSAAAQFLQILDEEGTQGVFFWGNGSLIQSGLDRPLVLGGVVAAAVLLAPLLARPLDLMALGDEAAEAMGARVGRIRPAAWLLAVLLAAAAVTLAGPVGYVGLIAPVAVRMLGVRRHAALLPLAGLAGALLVLVADAAAQLAFPPSAGYGELPVGVVTALIGGPVFVLLARRATTGDADTGAAVAVARPQPGPRYATALGVGAAAVAVAVLLGLRVGDVDITWGQIVGAVFGSAEPMAAEVVAYRMPRILVAALAGACLAAAGAAVQSVVRNPLAEPGLVGVTAGASAGAVLLIVVIPTAPAFLLPMSAAVGGVLALALVLLLARDRAGLDPTRVVLVGLGVAATAGAAVNTMVVGSQMDTSAALIWMAGSTYGRDLTTLGWLVVPAVVAVALTAAARPVNMLALGDDLPRALGLDISRARMLVLGSAAVLAAGTAAAVGTVGFVGLVAPHLARRLVGSHTGRVVPMAAVLGAVLLVASDALGRMLLAPVEIPVGVVTALLGAPYLMWLLRRGGR